MAWQDWKERLIVMGVFSGLIFPMRIVFYTYLSHYWIGSFGVLTAVTAALLYLSNRNKLGVVGKAIKKRTMKRSKTKMTKLWMAQAIFFIYVSSIMVAGSTYANPVIVVQAKQVLATKGIHDMKTLEAHSKEVDPITAIEVIPIILTPNPASFAIMDIVNQWSNGYMLSFYTVFMVDQIEFLGIVVYIRYFYKVPPERATNNYE